jgi:TusA-related sulfurtransferase
MTIINFTKRQKCIERAQSGEDLEVLSKEYKITIPTLKKWLEARIRVQSPEYIEVRFDIIHDSIAEVREISNTCTHDNRNILLRIERLEKSFNETLNGVALFVIKMEQYEQSFYDTLRKTDSKLSDLMKQKLEDLQKQIDDKLERTNGT